MEVIKPMAKKIKLSEAAKDLNIPAQELIVYFTEKGDTKKSVVVTDYVTPVNAMEQLYMTVYVQ